MAAILTSRQGRQGPQAVLPVRVPRHGHRGPAARRERVRAGLRAGARRRAARSATACRRCATWARAPCSRSSRRARAKGAFTSFADFCRKVEPSVLTKRVLESLILAGAFDSLGLHARAALARAARTRSRRRSSPSARPRPPGSSRCSAAATTATPARDRRVRPAGRGVRQARPAPPWRRRCSASSSPTTRCSRCEDALAAQTTHEIARPARPRRRRPRHDRRHHRRGRAQVHEAGRALRAVPPGGARRRRRGRGVPERVRGGAGADRDRRDRARARAASTCAGRELQIRAIEVREPDLGGRAAPVAPAPASLVVDLPAAALHAGGAREAEGAASRRTRGRRRCGCGSWRPRASRRSRSGAFRVNPAGNLLGELRMLLGPARPASSATSPSSP